MNDGPVFQSNYLYKQGKRYDLEVLSWIFDCPHCEYVTTSLAKEGAETALDMHFFHHHPEARVPQLDTRTNKEILDDMFHDFTRRGYSSVGGIRDAARS